MGIFGDLKRLRRFEQCYLPQLTSLEDFDMVWEIGYHQEQGTPLTLKQLLLLNIAPGATLQRRLRRLLALGVIRKHSSTDDRRSRVLTVSPRTEQVFERYARLLARL
ncbi:MAG: hypothetical protein HYU77_01850 [Betaproteobacteria bacterium]|nr:hypothetical protein [Betaproteobacteria bacterium]